MEGLDLFTSMNSKFVHLERNTHINMDNLYSLVRQQKCDIDKQSLSLLLTIAMIDPNEFAYLLHSGPGFTASRFGEVLYVSQCQAVFVSYRKTQKCYLELPITYKNQSYFITPRTHLIQKLGSEISCDSVFQPIYRINTGWFKINQVATETVTPMKLSPKNSQVWEYKSIDNLARAGIYSQEDLDDLRSHLMFGQERMAVETMLVRGAQGLHPDYQGISPTDIFDEDLVTKLGTRVGERMWNWFIAFGSVSSGIIGVMCFFKIVKWMVDSMINGTLLYQVFGFSTKILACVLDSLTHFFVYSANKAKSEERSKQETEQVNSEETCRLTIAHNTTAHMLVQPPLTTANVTQLPDKHIIHH